MYANENALTDNEERRRFFRVDDSIHFSYRIVGDDELPDSTEALDQLMTDGFSIMPNLNAINQQMVACLHKIEQQDSDVASYLKALDQKIEMLAKSFLEKESGITAQPVRPVNLSAGGMAVSSTEAVVEGAMLEMKILLLPTFTGVLTFGRVVSCEQVAGDTDYPYCLRINFIHMRSVDRDALIRHLLRRQGEMLRKRRQEQDGDGEQGDRKGTNTSDQNY